MRALVVTNINIYCNEGKVYLPEQVFYIVKRYGEFFGKVDLFTRISSTRPNIKLIDATEYVGEVRGYRKKLQFFSAKVKRALNDLVKESDLVITRQPAPIACYAGKYSKKNGKKHLAEVMGDAFAAFWYHSLKGKVVAIPLFIANRHAIKNSDYALYVTKKSLQTAYPTRGLACGCSDVKIDPISDQLRERRYERIESYGSGGAVKLSTIGATNVRYKGHAFVIKAISRLKKEGLVYKYTIIGGGNQVRLKKLAERLGVSDDVVFAGRCSMEEVFRLLDETDIYVHPSLTEGLPRSILEAQSRGCATIGTAAGGIPEILPKENLFGKGDVSGIAELLRSYTVEKLRAEAEYNIKFVEKFLLENSDDVRRAFFDEIVKDLENKQ